jgi:heterodisulfide reductase subunit A-like polyferredoxin
LDLADAGFKVYLVEKSAAIGGHMAQLDKTFPTNDCAMCTISPRLVAAGTHRNIEIITRAELAELDGEAGDFSVRLNLQPHFVDLTKCTGCGECATQCPVKVEDEYNQNLNDRKSIFKQYPQAVPNKFAMTREGIAPCLDACPVSGNPSGYVALTAAGNFQEAFESATVNNPLPSVCGRICEHPCEQACNRENLDSPVSIAYIKRFLSDWHKEQGTKLTRDEKLALIEENGKKVAIVGAGPAGLAAGLKLRQAGYGVTIFEKHGVPGGMMRLGVPAYRLPVDSISNDIEAILEWGIEVRFNHEIKGQQDIDAFFSEGFESVFLSVGSHKAIGMRLEGEDSENVSLGIDFLRDVRLDKKSSVRENVIVIGGGNVAMDCARTARRMGAKKVTLVCLEAREKMPAYSWEVDWAEEEGIEMQPAKATKRIVTKDGAFAGLELSDVKNMAFVEGRLELETMEGSEKILDASELIIAIGQKPALDFLGDGSKIKLTKRGTVEIDEYGQTSQKGVFAGGDVIRGAASVVQAMADGQLAAAGIDAYIKGEEFKADENTEKIVEISAQELKERREKKIARNEMPVIPIKKRMASFDEKDLGEGRVSAFDEVDLGFTQEQVQNEASRCLYCAVCSSCGLCEKVCEAGAIFYDDTQKERELRAGAVILAPGFDYYDAAQKGEYGYGRFPNVVSAMDYERILSASGPFEGHIQKLSDGGEPKKIAFIQCVGSRDTERPYCSSVCCMHATKQAIITKEHLPDVQCDIFVMDIRAFGKGFDEYIERAKDRYGVKYIYTRPSAVRQNFETMGCTLEFTEDGKNWKEDEYDMVVLASGLCTAEGAKELAEVCGIELDEYGFAKEDGFNLTASAKKGIYLAGAFQSPKDIPESVIQASSAAGCAMELLADARGSEVEDKIYPAEKDVIDKAPRLGVFVCHCGSNIGGIIDCKRVAEYASGLDGVVFATNLMYTCSPDGLNVIRDSIVEHDLNRVVVASCTPRTHEPLFQETIREAGLNTYLFEMANIRDQCTWVHAKMGAVTEEKAIDLVKMAVGRARTIEALEAKTYIPKRGGLVVGGGVAGMTAALSVADQGFDVHLVEKSAELGGRLPKVKRTIEGRDPAKLLEDLKAQIAGNKKITVHTNSTIDECKGFVGNFHSKINTGSGIIDIEHGAAIIATGADESKPSEYLYGSNDKVITQMQFEERLEDKKFAAGLNEVVMIQCVGSREPDHMICSRVCCTEAIKNAMAVKTANPNATVAVLYRDVRTYGLKEKYYNQAREMGVMFFRYDLNGKPVVSDDSGKLTVTVTDLSSGLELEFTPDILGLSAAMVTDEGIKDVGTAFKVPITSECFFLEAHMKLRPVDFASDGLFLCGTCHGPKFIDESIAQAKATAARAASILSKSVMEISGVVSVVEPDKCAACLTCVRTCPYNIPKINDDGVAEIEMAMCHGCGVCAGECPAKAIQLMHYKDDQVTAKTKALFEDESKVKS